MLAAPADAQVRDTSRVRGDSVRLRIPIPPGVDSLLRRDSAAVRADTAPPPRDTIQPPLGRAPLPRIAGADEPYRWTGPEILATGALTLADLLDRVPGVHVFRTGWIANPSLATVAGDFRSVRIYLDGFELNALDPRSAGHLDLSLFQLATLEDVLVERGAGELRVHLRSWRVERTTPFTRTDIATGDQQTNLYRGLFGKRWGGGQVIQAAAQQYGTTPPSFAGSSSDQLSIFARAGWANQRGLSFDGVVNRTSRHRGTILAFEPPGADDSIPASTAARTDAYLRAALGDPDSSRRWVQLQAGLSRYGSEGPERPLGVPADSILPDPDTTRSQSQYLVSGGTRAGPLELAATGRVIVRDSGTFATPTLSAAYRSGLLLATARWEGAGVDSTSRAELLAEVRPLSWIRLTGSIGRAVRDTGEGDWSGTSARVEGALRFRDLWFGAGALRRDSVRLAAPVLFDTTFTVADAPRATGLTASIRGRMWKSVYLDLAGVRWADSTGLYRPQYQTRSELALRTTLPRRFPTGNFGIVAAAVHEYRSGVTFPVGDELRSVRGFRTLSTLLEIRIVNAVVSWQFRNFLGESYKQVPDYLLNRQTNFYGVRWQFWN